MTIKKNVLPPPMNFQEKPITVAVLTGKLDALFKNVQELVTTTARGTENVLGKRIDSLESEMQGMKTDMRGMEKRLSDKIDNVGKRVDDHETRLSAVEEKVQTHLAVHP